MTEPLFVTLFSFKYLGMGNLSGVRIWIERYLAQDGEFEGLPERYPFLLEIFNVCQLAIEEYRHIDRHAMKSMADDPGPHDFFASVGVEDINRISLIEQAIMSEFAHLGFVMLGESPMPIRAVIPFDLISASISSSSIVTSTLSLHLRS